MKRVSKILMTLSWKEKNLFYNSGNFSMLKVKQKLTQSHKDSGGKDNNIPPEQTQFTRWRRAKSFALKYLGLNCGIILFSGSLPATASGCCCAV